MSPASSLRPWRPTWRASARRTGRNRRLRRRPMLRPGPWPRAGRAWWWWTRPPCSAAGTWRPCCAPRRSTATRSSWWGTATRSSPWARASPSSASWRPRKQSGQLVSLTENYRQRDAQLRQAVDLARNGHMRASLDLLNENHKIQEIEDASQRRAAVAKLYDKDTLIVTGSRQSREELNLLIREELAQQGRARRRPRLQPHLAGRGRRQAIGQAGDRRGRARGVLAERVQGLRRAQRRGRDRDQDRQEHARRPARGRPPGRAGPGALRRPRLRLRPHDLQEPGADLRQGRSGGRHVNAAAAGPAQHLRPDHAGARGRADHHG